MSLRVLVYGFCAAIVIVAGLSGATIPPTTERVSVSTAGEQGNNNSVSPAISGDGRFVAFASAASNLVRDDTNSMFDVFVRDRLTGTVERVSVDSLGNQANAPSGLTTSGAGHGLSITADGCLVAFVSNATNLVVDDTNQVSDVFVHDRCGSGGTERVNVGASGQADGVFAFGGVFGSGHTGVAISDDGRFVAFDSYATNLVAGDTNFDGDIFVRDRQAGTTERVSVDSAGTELIDPLFLGSAFSPAISADGRFVVFESQASNVVAGDANGVFDVFVRDRQSRTTERISIGADNVEANGPSAALVTNGSDVGISSDGRFVVFTSFASNLVADDTNGVLDIFVRDRLAGTTERVSVDSGGREANSSSHSPAINTNGRFIAFVSPGGLVSGGLGVADAFVRDMQNHTTERVSVSTAGAGGQNDSFAPAVNEDGRFVAFASLAPNLVETDTNAGFDIFVRDRGAVVDTQPPTLIVPATITVDAMSPDGAVVTFVVTATDDIDQDVPVLCTPASGTVFPIGTTTVACAAADDAGNTSMASFDVVVVRRTVPFAVFDASVERDATGQLELKSRFVLGAGSNGIQPTAETITIRIGSFEAVLAAGSFVIDAKGQFRFNGLVNGVKLEARLKPLGGGGFEFKTEAHSPGVLVGRPVVVSLTIGDDTGTATAVVQRG